MNFQPTQPQAMFMAIIGQLPSSANTPWSAATEQMFLIGLRSIPDEGLPKLCEAVLDLCKFRPTVHEIKDVWKQLTAAQDALTPADIVAALSGYVQKYGAYAAPHPTLKNVRVIGPPPEMTPQEAAVVACWGGWEHYANDDSPVGVKRGQALKVAEMVIRGGADEDIRRLRLEYREQQAALPKPALELLPPEREPLEGDGEQAGLVRMGSLGMKGLK